MNRPTFDQTVSVLVKAYLNDTLVHGNCYACAVGNIVASSIGVTKFEQGTLHLYWSGFNERADYPGNNKGYPQGWGGVFCTDNHRQIIKAHVYDECRAAKEQIDSTGYSWEELAIIEEAFESADPFERDRMFLGLMNVIDVLAQIHNIDLSQKEEAKKLFVKS